MGLAVNIKAETGLVDRTENTERYYRDIKKYPLLTPEEEKELFIAMREGSECEKKAARDKIILANQRFVVSVAKKYSTTDTLLDHIEECNIALLECIDSFDVSVGTKFTTYAVWYMKTRMNEYRTRTEPFVKKPNYGKVFHCISAAINQFIQEHERSPYNDELLEIVNKKYGKKVKDKYDLLDIIKTRYDMSQDDEDEDYSPDVTKFYAESATHNGYIEIEEDDSRKSAIEMMLSTLSPREEQFLRLKFGFYESDKTGFKRELTYKEIGDEMGLTAERMRQMDKEIMKKLKARFKDKIQNFL
jgi:RNA polymerase primary sigma factor